MNLVGRSLIWTLPFLFSACATTPTPEPAYFNPPPKNHSSYFPPLPWPSAKTQDSDETLESQASN